MVIPQLKLLALITDKQIWLSVINRARGFFINGLGPISTSTLVTSTDSKFHSKIPKNISLIRGLIYNFGNYS
jgi:hypothetical protein